MQGVIFTKESRNLAQKEDVLWDILTYLNGNTAHWTITLLDKPQNHEQKNGMGVANLKSELVLKHLPTDIEDTIYFMKHRNYLRTHGQGMVMPELVYSLTEKGVEVAKAKELPEEEKVAFKESLWKIEPNFYGVGPSIPAWKKMFKKLFNL